MPEVIQSGMFITGVAYVYYIADLLKCILQRPKVCGSAAGEKKRIPHSGLPCRKCDLPVPYST